MSRLLSNMIYLISERVFLLGINLVSNIIIIRYLGVHDFGSLALFQVYYALVISISEFGLRRVYSSLKSTTRESIVFFQSFKFKLIASSLLAIFIFSIIKVFNFPSFYYFLLLAVIASPFELYVYHFESNLENAILVKLRITINITLSLLRILLCFLGAELQYLIATYAFNNIIINAFCFYLSRVRGFSFYKLQSNRAKSIVSKHIIERSLFFWLSMIIVQINMRTDQLMLSAYASVIEVGIYAGAYKLIEQLMTIPSVLASVYLPYMSKVDGNNKPRFLEDLYLYSLLLSLPLGFLLFFAAPYLIPLLLGDAFSKSIIIFQLLAVAFPFLVLANFSGLFYSVFMLEKLAIYRNAMGLLVSLVSNYFFIDMFGAVGAAVSVVLSFFFISFIAEIFVPKARENVFMKYRAVKKIFETETYLKLITHIKNVKR